MERNDSLGQGSVEGRKQLAGIMEEIAQRNSDRDPLEIEKAIDHAVKEVRAERRKKSAGDSPPE